ncbi:11899_t:CDS:2, partial [Dentiscutata erythropus]
MFSKKQYKVKHALVTITLCKNCSERFRCKESVVKDRSLCKRCEKNHVHCRNSCQKCCKRYQCNDLICSNCVEEGIKCKRTMITTREQFKKVNEQGVKYFSGQYERDETGRFHEQCYIQLNSWMNFKRIKEIFENMSMNIMNNFYGGDKNDHCDKCDDSCQELRELLIVCDSLGNELTSEQKGPFIFGEENFKERIGNEKVKIDEKEQGGFEKAVNIILDPTTNYEFINIFKRDPKMDEDENLTNKSLRYSGSVIISYIDKDGDEKELLLTLENFEYDKTLNYENGNRKRRMSYKKNEGESENIKHGRFDESGIFANENVVNEWYNAVKELQRLNPAQEKFAIEKVDSNWYTLPHSDHIIQLIYNVHKKELTSFKGKCFFLLLGDVNRFGGRNMPLINNGGGSGSGGGNSTGNPNNPGSNSGSGNTSGNPGSNTGQGGNPTSGNTTGPNTGTGNTGGSGNSTGSNPNESGANKPNNSGSGLNQKQKKPKGGLKQNQQNVPRIKQIPIKQLPIKQRPVIREDQIRDDRIIGDQAKQIINQPKIPIPRQIPISVLEPQVDRARRRIEERQRDIDQQVREDVDVIDNVQQIVVVEKQPPPLQQQNEDRNIDPQDFTRCSICNTPLREAMNGNPE